MKELLDKLSSYNIFNYLLPGVLFVVLLGKFTTYSLIQDNLVIGVFVYYFIGLVVSRFGSLVIEPILRKTSFVQFAPYAHFVAASKSDPTLEILSEVNNMYRTLASMLVLLLSCSAYQWLEATLPSLKPWDKYTFTILLLIMFLFSYRKQTEYVRKRIEANRHLSL
jgi:hypothetical protein